MAHSVCTMQLKAILFYLSQLQCSKHVFVTRYLS